MGGWERQLLAPGPWGWASARLGPGRVLRRCRLNPGVPARRGDTGFCGLLRRSLFAWPGTETGKSGDCVWSCPFQPLAERWVGIRGEERAKLLVLGGPGGFLEVWELIWEGLFGSAWQGGRDWGFVASRRSGPRYLGGQKKTPVVFTGAWFLEKIRGRSDRIRGAFGKQTACTLTRRAGHLLWSVGISAGPDIPGR